MNTATNDAFCAELEKNIADEAEARAGYYKILSIYGPALSETERVWIYNIIEEELKHTKWLNQMVVRRSGIYPEDEYE